MSRPLADTRSASHGRGGAGNINSRPENNGASSVDLQTPTIKQQTYTTGRGGSGNMASNDPSNPAVARAAQDLDTPTHHSKDLQGYHHFGRGGDGNLVAVGDGAKSRTLSKGGAERKGSLSWVDKGKELLGMGKKPSDESAVE